MYINCINTYSNYRAFDKSFKQKYNNHNAGAVQMSQFQKYIDIIKSSYKLQSSPVAFIVPIIEKYLSDDSITDEMFAENMLSETKKAQFMFSKMNAVDIASNQRLFNKEFLFADKVNKEIINSKQEKPLKSRIISAIESYDKPY